MPQELAEAMFALDKRLVELLTRLALALRLGAVVAASGPVILTASGLGRQSVGWFCSVKSPAFFPWEGPYALEDVPGELLFWGVLLLPVVIAGLVLRGSRWATLTAVAAVGAVFALGLVIAFPLPGLDPCTGQERALVPPWPLLVCYPVAAGALLAAARVPLPRGPYGIVLWAGAAGAAAWAAIFHRHPIIHGGRELTVVYMAPGLSWDDLAWRLGTADLIGLPVVLVALAGVAASTRWGRLTGTATAAALLPLPLLDIATYTGDFQEPLAESVRWHLLFAALLVAWATWSPRVRTSSTGAVRRMRGRLPSKAEIPGRARHLTVALVIAAAAVWLIVSSFTPTR